MRRSKIHLMRFIVSLFSLFTITGISYGQWQPEVLLIGSSLGSKLSYGNARCIAANGNTVLAVWSDLRDLNYEIYFKRSTDAGLTWEADTRLTNDPAASRFPSIIIMNTTVHIVWYDERYNKEIYYKRSTDNGTTWGLDTRLTNNSGNSMYPSIYAFNQLLCVAWQDDRDSSANNIYCKTSSDGGTTWGPDAALTNRSTNSTYPSVSINGLNIYVVWRDERASVSRIYFRRSTDAGSTWESEQLISNSSYSSFVPSVASNTNKVYCVWAVTYNARSKVFYNSSPTRGDYWNTSGFLISDSVDESSPNINSYGPNVHVAMLRLTTYPNVWYMRSGYEGMYWNNPDAVTNVNNIKNLPHICASGTVVHTIWEDSRSPNAIYYARNPSANLRGEHISGVTPSMYALSQNYPNPFNPVTKIKFDIPENGKLNSGKGIVTLKVYDIFGKEVATLINSKLSPGSYIVDFDGNGLASGIYFYQLAADNETLGIKRMVLIK